MPHPMAVDPHALRAAAAAIDEQSARVAAVHAAWDAAVRESLPGWIGQSLGALEAVTGQWSADSAALADRLGEFAAGLRTAAASFAEADRLHAGALTE